MVLISLMYSMAQPFYEASVPVPLQPPPLNLSIIWKSPGIKYAPMLVLKMVNT